MKIKIINNKIQIKVSKMVKKFLNLFLIYKKAKMLKIVKLKL